MAEAVHINKKHTVEVMTSMYQQALKKEHTDFAIIMGRKVVHCHSGVVKAKSELINELCKKGIAKAVIETTKQGDEEHILDEVLMFLYLGTANIHDCNVQHLFHAAAILKCQQLKDQCEDFMLANPSMETLAVYQKLAKRHNLPRLKESCNRLNKEPISIVSKSPWFTELSIDHVEQYLKDDDLNTPREDDVIPAALGWVYNNSATMAEKDALMNRLLPCIRLPYCNRQYLKALSTDEHLPQTLRLGLLAHLYEGQHARHKPRRAFTDQVRAKEVDFKASEATTSSGNGAASSRTPVCRNLCTNGIDKTKEWLAKSYEGKEGRGTYGVEHGRGTKKEHERGTSGGEHGKGTNKEQEREQYGGEHGAEYESVPGLEKRVLILGGFTPGIVPYPHALEMKLDKDTQPRVITHTPSNNFALCGMEHLLYLSGGQDFKTYNSSSIVRTLDLNTMKWSSLPDMLEPVHCHGSAIVENKLYAVGGRFREGGKVKYLYSSVSFLNLSTLKWTPCKPLSLKVDDPGIAVVDHEMIVIGGYTGQAWSFKVTKLNTRTGQWVACQDLPKSDTFLRSTVVVRGHVFVAAKSLLWYNVDHNQWTELTPPPRKCWHCALVLHEGQLVLLGGYESKQEEPNDTIQTYDIIEKTWRTKRINLPHALCEHWAVVANKILI